MLKNVKIAHIIYAMTKEFAMIKLQIVKMRKLMEKNVIKNAAQLETVLNVKEIKLAFPVLTKQFMVISVIYTAIIVQKIFVI